MKNPIYINARFDTELIETHFDIKFSPATKNYLTITEKLWYEPNLIHARTTIPANWHNWNTDTLSMHRIPTFNPTYNLSFEEVTNLRALEIERYHEETGLPILITWSGGIDSTTVVSAVVKNFKKSTLSAVTILLNNSSYFENPVFFNKIIKPQLKYDNIEKYQDAPWKNHIYISGEPADSIWIHADILELNQRFPGTSLKNFRTDSDVLIKFLGSKSNIDHAVWFYNMILEDIDSHAPMLLETYEDFWWWINFNFYMCGLCLKSFIKDSRNHNSDSFVLYRTNYKPWFMSELYQQWSMNNNSNGIKINGTLQSYKLPAKQYIFDLDQNPYYYHYKSKTGSSNQYYSTDKPLNRILALYNDGSVLRFNDPACKEFLLQGC